MSQFFNAIRRNTIKVSSLIRTHTYKSTNGFVDTIKGLGMVGAFLGTLGLGSLVLDVEMGIYDDNANVSEWKKNIVELRTKLIND